VTKTRYLPLLIPCPQTEREGTVAVWQGDKFEGGKPVKTLHYRALDLFGKDAGAFQKKYGPLTPDERQRLRNFLKFADAVRQGGKSKLTHAAEKYLYLYGQEATEAVQDPLAYLQDHVNRTAKAPVVLWQERKSKELAAGIFCEDILIGTAVLVLFRIASAQAGETGECVVCKKVFVREHGDRRKTCSDKCRKQKSRLQNKGKPHRKIMTTSEL